MKKFRQSILLVVIALGSLLGGVANAQFWPARKMVAEVSAPVIAGKDKNGHVVDTFQRAWVERSIAVLDRLAPMYGLTSPNLLINKGKGPNAFVTFAKGQPVMAISTDMLRLAGDSDDMMAAVIGHELGHLKAEHLTKGAVTAATVSILGVILGAVIDANQARRGNDTQGAGVALGSLGAGLVTSKFSRDQEREADNLGITAMAQAGYDPFAAPRLWQAMATRGSSSGLWLDSHPSHAEREHAMAEKARSLQTVYLANRPTDSPGSLRTSPVVQVPVLANTGQSFSREVCADAHAKAGDVYQADGNRRGLITERLGQSLQCSDERFPTRVVVQFAEEQPAIQENKEVPTTVSSSQSANSSSAGRKLRELNNLLKEGLITPEDYEEKKQEILKSF